MTRKVRGQRKRQDNEGGQERTEVKEGLRSREDRGQGRTQVKEGSRTRTDHRKRTIS